MDEILEMYFSVIQCKEEGCGAKIIINSGEEECGVCGSENIEFKAVEVTYDEAAKKFPEYVLPDDTIIDDEDEI